VQPFNYSGKSAIFRTEVAKSGLELALDPVNGCGFTSYWIDTKRNQAYTALQHPLRSTRSHLCQHEIVRKRAAGTSFTARPNVQQRLD
jgi:hypothetical protein